MRRGGYGSATSRTTHANRAVRLSVSKQKPRFRDDQLRGFSLVRCNRQCIWSAYQTAQAYNSGRDGAKKKPREGSHRGREVEE